MDNYLNIGDKVWYVPYLNPISPYEDEIIAVYINYERIIRKESDNECSTVHYKTRSGIMAHSGEVFTSLKEAEKVYTKKLIDEYKDKLEKTKYNLDCNKDSIKQLTKILKELTNG